MTLAGRALLAGSILIVAAALVGCTVHAAGQSRVYLPVASSEHAPVATQSPTPTSAALSPTPTPLDLRRVSVGFAYASSSANGHDAASTLDSQSETYWQPAVGDTSPSAFLALSGAQTVTGVRLERSSPRE